MLPWRRLQSCWHQVEGRRLHGRFLSDLAPAAAPWVVLVHGLGVSSRYMSPLALALAPRYRVAVPDLPGHGRTARHGPTLDVPQQADVLGSWLGVAGIERPHLVANSLGCQIVLRLAGSRRIELAGLTLVGPTMDPAAPTVMGQTLRLLRDAALEKPWLVALVAAEQLHRPAQAIRELASGLRLDTESCARRVTTPTTVVRGARDPIAPRSWTQQLAQWLPNATAVNLSVGAHAVHATHPHRIAALVDGD